MTFADFLTFVDLVDHHAVRLHRTLSTVSGGELHGAVLAEVERIATYAQPWLPLRRPGDVIEEEWQEPATALLRARLETLVAWCGARPPDRADWYRELTLASDDYHTAWVRFDAATER